MIRQLESKSFLFFLRDHLRSTLGITCGRGSFAVSGSFAVGDHLWYCTFPHVSSHKDLQHSAHCMQIILKSSLSVSTLGYEKCFVFKGYYNIQTYLPFLG